MSDSHRAALLRLAGRRGEKGFSRLVAEAVAAYLSARGEADAAGALRLRGILSRKDAQAYRGRVSALRENWR